MAIKEDNGDEGPQERPIVGRPDGTSLTWSNLQAWVRWAEGLERNLAGMKMLYDVSLEEVWNQRGRAVKLSEELEKAREEIARLTEAKTESCWCVIFPFDSDRESAEEFLKDMEEKDWECIVVQMPDPMPKQPISDPSLKTVRG